MDLVILRVMLVGCCESRNTGVEVSDSRSMHVWLTVMLGSRSIIDLLIVILCVEVGIARWLTPTNSSPRSMRLALCFDY